MVHMHALQAAMGCIDIDCRRSPAHACGTSLDVSIYNVFRFEQRAVEEIYNLYAESLAQLK